MDTERTGATADTQSKSLRDRPRHPGEAEKSRPTGAIAQKKAGRSPDPRVGAEPTRLAATERRAGRRDFSGPSPPGPPDPKTVKAGPAEKAATFAAAHHRANHGPGILGARQEFEPRRGMEQGALAVRLQFACHRFERHALDPQCHRSRPPALAPDCGRHRPRWN